ncbi:MAG TPA: YccF domain-containing protein [Actinomycetota bacterium]|nr:YccF domain-containing protein [Actinomycetota bacterium]
MRTIGNVLWLLLGGIELALGYLVAALLAIVFIVTIPFAVPAVRLALFCLWPFGRTLVKKPEAGAGSAIGNVVWLILFGWWLALGHLVAAFLMAITIIGIPFAIAHTKLAVTALWPFGTEVVSIDSLPVGSNSIVVGGQPN